MKSKKPDKRAAGSKAKQPPRATANTTREPVREGTRKEKGSGAIRLVRTEVARRVRELAVASLPLQRRRTTNLYLDHRVLEPGETLGPQFETELIHIDVPSVLCFVDHQPNSNYSHDCQYMLFDPESGRELRRIGARFPPYEMEGRGTLRLFHGPVPVEPRAISINREAIPPCPMLPPDGRRYAILFAGVAQWHHVNDLELSYRTLIQYGFDKNDIFVLCHDGVKSANSGLFSDGSGALRKWPGDNTDFVMKPDHPGTAAALKQVLATLAGQMTAQDMLFIHLDGHGGCDAIPDTDPRRQKGSFLCTWSSGNPIGGKYFAVDLQDDLNAIPMKYRSLLVLAQQCHGGGFKQSVIDGSTALATSIACAAEKSGLSYWSPDRNFNNFALDWLCAQRRQLIDGTSLVSDVNSSGAIEANEAYDYAMAKRDVRDSPNRASAPLGADLQIALSDPNPLAADWCALVAPLTNGYRQGQSDAQYYQQLYRALPRLRSLVLPVLKMHAGAIRKELVPKIEGVLNEVFGGKPTVPRHPSEEETKQAG